MHEANKEEILITFFQDDSQVLIHLKAQSSLLGPRTVKLYSGMIYELDLRLTGKGTDNLNLPLITHLRHKRNHICKFYYKSQR